MAYFQNNSGFTYDSTNTTYISKFSIYNNNNHIINRPFVDIDTLRGTIVSSLRRWNLLTAEDTGIWEQHREISSVFADGYIDTYKLFTNWVIIVIQIGKPDSTNKNADFIVTMYASGRYRRNGSSVDYFEQVMDGLYTQIKNPDKIFNTLRDCYEHSLDEQLEHFDFTLNTDKQDNNVNNNEEVTF